MGGNHIEDNMTQTHGSYNGAQITKREIMEAYESKILEKYGEERSKGRNVVEGMAVDFLLTVQHSVKFCRVVVDVLNRSATGIRHWNPAAAARAFGHIESYAVNLWDHPWKKAYKIIKLYSGFYKTQIDPHITGASDLFRMMGYEGTPNTLVMRVKSSREQLVQIAVEAFLLSVECNLYYMILQRVEHMGYDILDVHQCRVEFTADTEASVEWISRNRKPFKRISEKPGDKSASEQINSCNTLEKPDQRSKSGASVLETVSDIESVLCKNGVEPTPQSILRQKEHESLRGKKAGRVSADSGIGSKPASKEITPIEESDAEIDEEFPPPPPALSPVRKNRAIKQQQEQKGRDMSPPSSHALGTAEEHQQISMQILDTLERKKSPVTEPSPVPPPRHSRSREWDHVTENLKTKYGQEYYEGPRGDILRLNDMAHPPGKAGKAGPVSLTKQEAGTTVRSSPRKDVLSPVNAELNVDTHSFSNIIRSPLSPPLYSQAVAVGHQSRPLTVSLPPDKRSVSPYENNGPVSYVLDGATCSDSDCRSESFESKIKRPPSAEDLLEEVLKADEKYKPSTDFSTFGKRQPPPRPSRTKRNAAARKSNYDNFPPLAPEVPRDIGLVGRGIGVDDADFYQSHSFREAPGAKTKRVTSVTDNNYAYPAINDDYGFNMDVTSVANRRRHTEPVHSNPRPANQSQSKPSSPSKSSAHQLWQCVMCTYANQPTNSACEMCGKSRESGAEGSPLRTGGPQCPHCTLVNEAGTQTCTACDSDLTGCATYI